MRTIKIKNINNFITISDVHLRQPHDKTTQLFIKTLDDIILDNKQNQKKIDSIFLLGDIFDFITVSKSFFLNLWKDVFNKFKEIKNAGIALYFIEGNHDFGFEHFHSKKLDEFFTDYGDFVIEFEHKKMGSMVLRHGDDIVCLPSYLKPRAFFKSNLFQKITSFLFTGFLMHFIFTRYAKKSRDRGEHYNKLTGPFLAECIRNYLISYKNKHGKKIDTLFIGHIHVFIDTIYCDTQFFVGPDWFSAPSYLYCNENGETKRIFCTNEKVDHFIF